jgi:hypothetical protein
MPFPRSPHTLAEQIWVSTTSERSVRRKGNHHRILDSRTAKEAGAKERDSGASGQVLRLHATDVADGKYA